MEWPGCGRGGAGEATQRAHGHILPRPPGSVPSGRALWCSPGSDFLDSLVQEKLRGLGGQTPGCVARPEPQEQFMEELVLKIKLQVQAFKPELKMLPRVPVAHIRDL